MKSRLAFFHQHALPARTCFAVAFLLTQSGLLQGIENLTVDARMKSRECSPVPSSAAILWHVSKLAQVAAVGFVDAPPGSSGVLRTVPLVVGIGDGIHPSLSLRTLIEHWDVKLNAQTAALDLSESCVGT